MRFLYVMFFSLILTNASFSQSMLPLKNYMSQNKNNLKDPAVLLYLTERCSALNLYISLILNTRSGNNDVAENAKNISKTFSLMAFNILVKEFNKTNLQAEKMVQESLDEKTKFYLNDGKNHQTRTGSYIEGSYMQDDMSLCSGIYKRKPQ